MAPNGGPPKAAIGCFMVPLGGVSGAMIAVLMSKIVAFFLKVSDCAEGMSVPCFWY